MKKKRSYGKRLYWIVYLHPLKIGEGIYKIYASRGSRVGKKIKGRIPRGGFDVHGLPAKSFHKAVSIAARHYRKDKRWVVKPSKNTYIVVRR